MSGTEIVLDTDAGIYASDSEYMSFVTLQWNGNVISIAEEKKTKRIFVSFFDDVNETRHMLGSIEELLQSLRSI